MEKQLNFFAEEPEDIMRFDIDRTRDQLRNLRRGVFTRLDQNSHEIEDLKRQVNQLEMLLKEKGKTKKLVQLRSVAMKLRK